MVKARIPQEECEHCHESSDHDENEEEPLCRSHLWRAVNIIAHQLHDTKIEIPVIADNLLWLSHAMQSLVFINSVAQPQYWDGYSWPHAPGALVCLHIRVQRDLGYPSGIYMRHHTIQYRSPLYPSQGLPFLVRGIHFFVFFNY